WKRLVSQRSPRPSLEERDAPPGTGKCARSRSRGGPNGGPRPWPLTPGQHNREPESRPLPEGTLCELNRQILARSPYCEQSAGWGNGNLRGRPLCRATKKRG